MAGATSEGLVVATRLNVLIRVAAECIIVVDAGEEWFPWFLLMI
jgi:hypothetical protein